MSAVMVGPGARAVAWEIPVLAHRLLFSVPLAVLVLLGIVSWAWPAHAEGEGDPRAAVVALGSGDETLDAKVRAALRNACEARGFGLVSGKRAADALAAADGLEGTGLTGDVAKLERVRAAHAAQVLVSAALASGGTSAEVSVVTADGTKSQGVEASPDALPAAVAAAAKRLLPAAAPRPPPAAGRAGPDAVILHDGTRIEGEVLRQEPGRYVVVRDVTGQQTIAWSDVKRVLIADAPGRQRGAAGVQLGGAGLGVSGALEDAEARRQAWKKRGGSLASYEVRLNATGVLFPEITVPSTPVMCTAAGGGLTTVSVPETKATAGGAGGGAGVRMGVFHLSPPEPGKGSGWTAFRFASGVDFSYVYSRYPIGLDAPQGRPCSEVSGREIPVKFDSTSMLQLNIPANIGVHFGLGGFGGGEKWSGLVVGIAYAPSYTYTKVAEASEGEGHFNYLGAELTLDITTLEAVLDKMATAAHFRMALFVLPPLKSDWPWVVTGGLGAVWY